MDDMFDEYTDTERVCQDCLSDRYFRYPDDKKRCKYCGHVEGTPTERSFAPAEEDVPIRITRKRSNA